MARAQNKLQLQQSFALCKELTEHYTNLKMTDPEFAKWAEEKLGFPVTEGNVQGHRSQLGIPSTQSRVRTAEQTAAEEVLAALARIEEKMDRLMKSLGEGV